MTNIEKWLVHHDFVLKDSNEIQGRTDQAWRIYGKGYVNVYVFLTNRSWSVEDTSDLSYETYEEIDKQRRARKSLCLALSQIENPWEEEKK